jgi:hypothetical protein
MRPIEAEHRGTCQDCDDDIRPGDLIVNTVDGWTHERCPSDAGALGTACKQCHLVHAGECF